MTRPAPPPQKLRIDMGELRGARLARLTGLEVANCMLVSGQVPPLPPEEGAPGGGAGGFFVPCSRDSCQGK